MQYLCAILPLWEFLVACRYTAWMRTDYAGRLLVGRLTGLWRRALLSGGVETWDYVRWIVVHWKAHYCGEVTVWTSVRTEAGEMAYWPVLGASLYRYYSCIHVYNSICAVRKKNGIVIFDITGVLLKSHFQIKATNHTWNKLAVIRKWDFRSM